MRRLIAAIGLIASALVASGQDRPPAAKPDPQATYEPRSGPGVGQAFLARFVGDWEVTKTFHSRSGEAAKTTGKCKQTMIHNGRFLRSEFTFGAGKDASTGTGVIGFDPATGKFTSVWTDAARLACRSVRAGTSSMANRLSSTPPPSTGTARARRGP